MNDESLDFFVGFGFFGSLSVIIGGVRFLFEGIVLVGGGYSVLLGLGESEFGNLNLFNLFLLFFFLDEHFGCQAFILFDLFFKYLGHLWFFGIFMQLLHDDGNLRVAVACEVVVSLRLVIIPPFRQLLRMLQLFSFRIHK